MVVQQNRKSPSTVLTAHNSTGNRTFMCNSPVLLSNSCCFAGGGGTGNISPFPSILLTPVDASPLNALVASGATIFGAILATVGRTVLAKNYASAPRNPPFLLRADSCFLLMFISTPVLSPLLILFICILLTIMENFP